MENSKFKYQYSNIFMKILYYATIFITIIINQKHVKCINTNTVASKNNHEFNVKNFDSNISYNNYESQNLLNKYNDNDIDDDDNDNHDDNIENNNSFQLTNIKVNQKNGGISERKNRIRRYLAFPEGASFTCAICATIGIIGNPNPAYMSFGMNWGLAYDLPNATWIFNHLYGFKKKYRYNNEHINNHSYNSYPSNLHYDHHNGYYYEKATTAITKRETRKSFYDEIQFFIKQTMGYDGRDCILRALCESSQFFDKKTKKTMLEEIIRTIFSLPNIKVFSFESTDLHEYDEAYRIGKKIDDCSLLYPGCQFSLLDLAFGKYSEPPTNLPKQKFANYNPFSNPLKFS